MDQKEKMELVELIKKTVKEAVHEEFAKMAAGGLLRKIADASPDLARTDANIMR